jgi:hypothetical protein
MIVIKCLREFWFFEFEEDARNVLYSFSFSALHLLKQDSDSTLDSSHFYGLEFMSCFDRWWICPLLIHFISPLVIPAPFYQFSRISK